MLALLAVGLLAAAAPLEAGGWDFSGVLDSTLRASWVPAYGGGHEELASGFEEYANLRLQAPIGEHGTVFAAVNLLAAAGSELRGPALVEGSGYASPIELERLYYRASTESMDVDVGLMRLAFGYGQAWRPTDFLNPPNPLVPDARPRGSLAVSATAYPSDLATLRVFLAMGDDPTRSDAAGALAGAAAELHGPKASTQVLYAAQVPPPGYTRALHRVGLSLKLEAEAAFVLDALYTLDADAAVSGDWYDRSWNPLRGLEAALGVDYSLLEGNAIAVLQYLLNGGSALEPGDSLSALYDPASGDWEDLAPVERSLRSDLPLAELNRRDYLYASLLYRFDDYTRATLACVAGLDDGSLVPSLTLDYEPFQGLAVSGCLRVPLDAQALGFGSAGELGPIHSGSRGELVLKGKVRF